MQLEPATADATAVMPLFPLGTVLFPGGPLPLRIFETRYVEMLRRCMRESGTFAVVALLTGSEVGAEGAGTMAEVGTTARIVDFDTLPGGLLGIICRGERKVKVVQRWQQDDGLHLARLEYAKPERGVAVPPEFSPLVQVLRRVLPEIRDLYSGIAEDLADASWVGCRLAEILPMSLVERQHCLQLDEPLERLSRLKALIRA